MSPSVEDNPTSSSNGTAEQRPVQTIHHAPSPASSEVRGKRVPPRRGSVDKDAQDLVVTSLRSQVQDLVSQVTELNNKLVKSYDRVSDLEDDLHVTSSTLRSSSVKISQLELERSQHLSALNTGLLVEKAHSDGGSCQARTAESARAAIEKDLDDVSAALFDQANTMVAEARLGRAQSDRKAEEAERALREAEDAVRLMQQELQALQGEKEAAERRMETMNAAMGKGKWIERAPSSPTNARRLLTSHISYQEFLTLISHLRALRATYPQAPTISSLLGLPFIARLQQEDTDPTLRLDMAAALNWLSRRTIIAAIQSGQLTIEPIAIQTILVSATSPQPPLVVNVIHGSNNTNLLSCGLCGHGIVPHSEPSPSRTASLLRANTSAQFNSWSSSIFRKSPGTPSHSEPPSPPPYHDTSSLPAHLYIFRLSDPSPAFASALPLCTSGWCLARLRASCSLWSFLRTSVLEKIWEEDVQALLPPPRREIEDANVSKPPVPPRRKTKNTGFWGVASSLGLDRVPGWGDNDKDKRPESEAEKRRFVAPLRSGSPSPSLLSPPPLPSRNRSRPRTPVRRDSGTEGRRSSGTESSARESRSSTSDSQELPVNVKPEVSPTLSSLLFSSPEGADPSNDDFLTPSEDPAPESPVSIQPLGSSHNTPVASSVPLPDDTEAARSESQPAAPVTPRKEASSNSEHVRATPLSPAGAVQPTSPPSRTGSPGAPPLPRRAAARRTVPPPPRAAPPVLSAPAPAPAPDVSSTRVTEQPNGHHVEPSESADVKATISSPVVASESNVPLSKESVSSPKEKEAEGTVSPVVGTTESAAPAAASIVETEAVIATEEVAELDGDQADEKKREHSTTDGDAAVAENSVEGAGAATATIATNESDAEPERLRRLEKWAQAEAEAEAEAEVEVEADERAAAKANHPPPPPPRHPRPVRPTERQALSDLGSLGKRGGGGKLDGPPVEDAESGPGFAPDGTPWVGDGTWEERTWKELGRLREDMFWARLGSVQ
ncbi:hypothetical protein BC827DRAFT_1271040 [Russula dissimulans]|nr:hypothetical protein BC827DRAFT_1271040 [Russula dissimulans]